MTAAQRRIIQAALFEALAVALVTPLLNAVFGGGALTNLLLTLSMSGIALIWNVSFNALYEAWEARHPVGGRPLLRRILHGLLFETGLTLLLVPLLVWWLKITWLAALLTDVSLSVIFVVYAVVFTWCFDMIFGLPASARAPLNPLIDPEAHDER